jgi:hypothetical protein
MRALRLAALVNRPAVLSVRGVEAALRVPAGPLERIADSAASTALARLRPDVLVIDDPNERAGRRWLAAARRYACPVVSLVDSGIGTRAADLVIDGSVAPPVRRLPRDRTLRGPALAVLDPAVAGWRGRPGPRGGAFIFLTLGGGCFGHYAARLAAALRPLARDGVVVAGGFVDGRPPVPLSGVRWLGPQPSLVPWLRGATVAVVAGGLTMYEACAIGVPTVAVPIVRPQGRAVSAMAAVGGVVPAWRRNGRPSVAAVTARVAALLGSPARRRALVRRSTAIVDGRGAFRVAMLLRRIDAGWAPAAVLEGRARHALLAAGRS